MQSLGDRIKRYEKTSRHYLNTRSPAVLRVDGKAFHTFLRGAQKPFDTKFIESMVLSAKSVAEKIQGFKVAYVQSDEATFFLTDYDNLETSAWFDYNVQKMCSITASMMTADFNSRYKNSEKSLGFFDCRAFNVPREDVANVFLWRAQDWARNSLQMYSRNFFSHRELHGKNQIDMHEMLHSIGKNWTTDLPDREKNGTFIINDERIGIVIKHDVLPKYDQINELIKNFV